MRRRQFITLLGGAAAAWPRGAWAQQTAMPEIVFFNSGRPTAQVKNLAAFRQGLKEISFVEGQNVAIEFRWAENQFDRLPALAADVVARRPCHHRVEYASGAAMARASPTLFTRPASMPGEFSRARRRAICRWSNPASSSS
jgi:putative tryptophan/tyrosine transport system substrate-binding protein